MQRHLWPLLLVLVLSGCNSATFNFLKYASPDTQDYSIFKTTTVAPDEQPFEFYRTDENITLPPPYLWAAEETVPLDWTPEEFLEKNDCLAFIVIRNDTILYENYFNGHSRNSISQVFSVTKSFTSALVGIAMEEGYIESIHQPVADFLPGFEENGKEKVTIFHLLQMTSGMAFTDYKNIVKLTRLYYGRDARKLARVIGMRYEPGEEFEYSSLGTQVLGMVVESATGQPLDQYLEDKLWSKIGTEYNALYATDPKGSPKAYGGMSVTPLDLAKFGRLYLNKGNWNGEQLVPENWVEAIREKDTTHGTWRYSYQWWLDTYPRRAKYGAPQDFFAGGFRGQVLYISPEENTIVLRVGLSEHGVRWPHANSKLSMLLNHPQPHEEIPAEMLATLGGKYRGKNGDTYVVRMDKGQLLLENEQLSEQTELMKESAISYVDRRKKVKLVLNVRNEDISGIFYEHDSDVEYLVKQ